MAVEIKMYI